MPRLGSNVNLRGGGACGAATAPDEDFAREVDSHVQLEADRLVEEGLTSRGGARSRRASASATPRWRASASTTRSRSLWFDQLKQDVRTALRGIKRYPIACAIAVISLAGGIGATTITLLLRNAIFLAPPPLYQDPDGAVVRAIADARQSAPARAGRLVQDLARRSGRSAGALGASAQPRQHDLRAGDRVESRPVRAVTPNLFTTPWRAPDDRHAAATNGRRRRSAGHAQRRRLVRSCSSSATTSSATSILIDGKAAHRDRRHAARGSGLRRWTDRSGRGIDVDADRPPSRRSTSWCGGRPSLSPGGADRAAACRRRALCRAAAGGSTAGSRHHAAGAGHADGQRRRPIRDHPADRAPCC